MNLSLQQQKFAEMAANNAIFMCGENDTQKQLFNKLTEQNCHSTDYWLEYITCTMNILENKSRLIDLKCLLEECLKVLHTSPMFTEGTFKNDNSYIKIQLTLISITGLVSC